MLECAGITLNDLLDATIRAGQVILEIKSGDLGVEIKSDSSPVTAADKASNAILLEALSQLYPDVPVISEEAEDSHSLAASPYYVLVDPLDGTKEFIRNDSQGSFTVNIGIIDQNKAAGGIVYAPMRDLLFWGVAGVASYLYTDNQLYQLDVNTPIAERNPAYPVAIASRSHRDEQTDAFLHNCGITEVMSVGSSLKFGYLAMGLADIYPRFGPTMEWDTAAGEAVLSGAGGQVFAQNGTPHHYGKSEWRNHAFIACGQFNPFTV